jgi:hypothetical protein
MVKVWALKRVDSSGTSLVRLNTNFFAPIRDNSVPFFRWPKRNCFFLHIVEKSLPESSVTYPADRGCTRISCERCGYLPREMHPHVCVMYSSPMRDAKSSWEMCIPTREATSPAAKWPCLSWEIRVHPRSAGYVTLLCMIAAGLKSKKIMKRTQKLLYFNFINLIQWFWLKNQFNSLTSRRN